MSEQKSGKGSSQSKQNNSNSSSTQGKGSTSEQKKSTTPNLSMKLGKYRKLTPQEHQHHLDNKLCLFCGTAGHVTVLECTSSVQGTGMDPKFRTLYMHPEKRIKAWFGSFQLQGGW